MPNHTVTGYLACVCVLAGWVVSLNGSVTYNRVRPVGAALADTLERGRRESPTLASLVDALEHSNVIVHIEARWAAHRPAAETMFIARAGRDRYLRIYVEARLPEDQVIALLGHELQHAWEIAQAPWVTDQCRLAELYRGIGYRVGSLAPRAIRVDSDAGHRIERQVRVELRGARSRRNTRVLAAAN